MLEDFPYMFDAENVPMSTYEEVDDAFRAATPGVEKWASTLSDVSRDEIMEHWSEAWLWLSDDAYGTCAELGDVIDALVYMDGAEKDNIIAFARKVFVQTGCWMYDCE